MSTTTIGVDESRPAVVPAGSKSCVASQPSRSRVKSHWSDLQHLLKPRISSMVLVTVALSVFVASAGHPDPWVLIHCLIGTALVSASSGALNQWLEKTTDAKMKRTQDRPLPAGRMSSAEVIAFGVGTLFIGTCYFLLTVGAMPTLWALATWIVYVCVYTPMKLRTSWNTTVGALSGALPILIGASAVQPSFNWQVSAMFCVLFFWQFPHFIAIAWIYRNEYSKAGLQMVTTTDPSGRSAGFYSFGVAIVLVAASLLPLMVSSSVGGAICYALVALLLGVYQLRAAWLFRRDLDDDSARKLLKASIIYLPLALGLIAVQTAL